MREIKFRAWDKDYKYMNHKVMVGNVWDEDNYHAHMIWIDGENVDYECESGWVNFDEYSNIEIMQFTGLKDENGTEIYEGDIVKGWYMEKGIKHRFIGQIKFVTGCFLVDGVKQYRGQRQELNIIFQPIGNIYENPELLGDSQ